LTDNIRGFSTWSLGSVVSELWWGRTSWWGHVVEQNCSPHDGQQQRASEEGGRPPITYFF
jgi:hypothetical protein